MKEKLKTVCIRMCTAIYRDPVEVMLAVVLCVCGILRYEAGLERDALLTYFPVFFLITYTLNAITQTSRWRWIYFFSFLFFVPLCWKEGKIDLTFYWVTILEVQLLYLISGWKKDNHAFFKKGLHYLRAVLSAVLLSGIAWVLFFSIYLSIRYIFEIGESEEGRFVAWSAILVFGGMLPLLFLTFNQNEEGEETSDKLFDLLLNYILSPALLIYAVILYLYFIKIAILGTLPKGAVAYIVVSFVSATFILKGCQSFLTHRYYDWFYRYAAFAVLPALAMYWIGAGYRIHQYGFTQPRVYLVVVGGILTGTVCLFMNGRSGRYLYAALLAIVLFGVVTYIPGFTAEDITRWSQLKRDADFDNKIWGKKKDYYENLHISSRKPVDIHPYRTFQIVKECSDNQGEISGKVDQDTLFLYEAGTTVLFKENISSLFESQLRKAGLSLTDSIPEASFPQLLQLDMDSALLILEGWSVQRNSPDSAYTVSYVAPAYYLKK